MVHVGGAESGVGGMLQLLWNSQSLLDDQRLTPMRNLIIFGSMPENPTHLATKKKHTHTQQLKIKMSSSFVVFEKSYKVSG